MYKKVQITREETSKKTIDYLDIYQIKNMIGMIINKDIRYTLTIVLNLIFVCNSLFKKIFLIHLYNRNILFKLYLWFFKIITQENNYESYHTKMGEYISGFNRNTYCPIQSISSIYLYTFDWCARLDDVWISDAR